jgi:predicted ATPase
MADLTTYENVEAELAATADYDVAQDADKAKRRIAALRRKLDFAAESSRDGQALKFQQQHIENQLNQALAWLRENGDQTNAQKLANPSVTHADFSTFRGYCS